ncbi:MAG: FAD-dependent oxidoreductase [Vicinamibacteraceae bacterium]
MHARQPTRIVIVGGGLAGVSAALDLLPHGLQVHVVEARDDLGGRVRTRAIVQNGSGVSVAATCRAAPSGKAPNSAHRC